ncbi:MAG: HAMP domain-containing histidine kinase [Clostridiales bacterium]|nr:HAMP domain-containing histidine kinase [Clostridiales bacterium]
MIRKLRIRLILISMAAVLLVLIILIGGINISNYRQVVSESDEILDILMENGGVFGENMLRAREEFERQNPDFDPDDFIPPEEMEELFSRNDRSGPRAFMRFDEGRTDSPELAYETRYFSVLIAADGTVLRTDTDRISAVSKSIANEYASRALRSKKNSGFIGDYRFLLGQQDDSGNRLVIFRDCGASLANFRNFRNISIFVSLLCLLLVGVIVFFASGHIVRPVAESYEKQKRFITDAGHEIKTPLAIISADVEVLEMELADTETESEEDASGNEWLTDIKAQTKRLSELTQDLILLSKMEESSTVLDMKDLNLSEIARNQAGSFEAVAIASDKSITTKIDDDIHIQGDKKSIESLLSIVLDNAVKYCPECGSIDVLVTKSKKGALIEITNDTSETLSPEDCKNMFARFYRTDASRNSTTGGHGIGLSIAKAIVDKHKGRIAAASHAEKKLTVSITL